jgi:hypothetical protein
MSDGPGGYVGQAVLDGRLEQGLELPNVPEVDLGLPRNAGQKEHQVEDEKRR